MPATGPIAYASSADLFGPQGYVRDPGPVNAPIATTLLNMASRFIDEKCGRFFYTDGTYQRFFDGHASREVTIWPDFYGKFGTIAACNANASTLTFTQAPQQGGPAPVAGDRFQLDIGGSNEQVTVASVSGSGPYTLTLSPGTTFGHLAGTIATTVKVQFAYYENQPFNQWLTVQGDGLTGGSTNWMLWPTNPKPYLITSSTATTPWQGFNLPMIPVTGTAYLPTPRPGSRTIAMTAYWGWPAIPDLIKDLVLKMTARAWLSRQDAWAHTSGDQSMGMVNMSHHFDSRDEALLIESGYVRMAI